MGILNFLALPFVVLGGLPTAFAVSDYSKISAIEQRLIDQGAIVVNKEAMETFYVHNPRWTAPPTLAQEAFHISIASLSKLSLLLAGVLAVNGTAFFAAFLLRRTAPLTSSAFE